MKKILLLFITLVSINQISLASFPVYDQGTTTEQENTEATSEINAMYGPEIDWTALYLALPPIGLMGAHRFYMGHHGIAVLQLMTAGGWGIWWLIDLIRIVKGDLYRGPLDPQFPTIDWAMLYLALFGGTFGLHRFYRNQTNKKGWPKKDKNIALWQLFTFGGFGIWYLIDIVKILTGKLYKR